LTYLSKDECSTSVLPLPVHLCDLIYRQFQIGIKSRPGSELSLPESSGPVQAPPAVEMEATVQSQADTILNGKGFVLPGRYSAGMIEPWDRKISGFDHASCSGSMHSNDGPISVRTTISDVKTE